MTLQELAREDYPFIQMSMQREGVHLGFCHRFFTPNEKFFQVLSKYKDKNFIDCGTGLGLVPQEMRAEGFKCVGLDICPRDGQQDDVVIMNSCAFPFNSHQVALVCRPSHDGFAIVTGRRALLQGAYFMYVGLPKNFVADEMDTLEAYRVESCADVGEEGESLLIFKHTPLVNV